MALREGENLFGRKAEYFVKRQSEIQSNISVISPIQRTDPVLLKPVTEFIVEESCNRAKTGILRKGTLYTKKRIKLILAFAIGVNGNYI